MPARSEGWGGAELSPIGRNINICSKTKVPINKERFANIYSDTSVLYFLFDIQIE
jgi:hypothetical protein